MDAVVVLDAAGGITRVNPPRRSCFVAPPEDLLGENLRDFLPPESAACFASFVKELEAQTTGARQLWIPQSFIALRWDKTPFPAEATLSRSRIAGRSFTHSFCATLTKGCRRRRIQSLTVQAEYLQLRFARSTTFDEIIGQARRCGRCCATWNRRRHGCRGAYQGETGTGKELFARHPCRQQAS